MPGIRFAEKRSARDLLAISLVCKKFNTTEDCITSTKKRSDMFARYTLMAVLNKLGWNKSKIGKMFGVHHSMVIYALKRPVDNELINSI